MRGELIGVWSETWREIWLPLIEQPLAEDDEGPPEDIFCELYRALAPALSPRPSVENLADIIGDPVQSREAFEATTANDLAGERVLVVFFEAAHDALEELGGDELTNRYFNLLTGFIDKFSLRYDLRRPCVLCPTLPGLFASLVRDLRALASQNLNLDQLMKEYEDAVRDLRFGCTAGRIKTCIGKQFMLLEAIGALDPGVTKNTLGDMCEQLDSWPHATIKEALKKLYGFASDYPGIRHGSRAKGRLRGIEMRDMVAMPILLTGFTPYLERRLSADAIYGWFARTYARAGRPAPGLAFDPTALPRPAATGQQTAEQLRRLEEGLRERDEKLATLLADGRARRGTQAPAGRGGQGQEGGCRTAGHARLLRGRDPRLLHRPAA